MRNVISTSHLPTLHGYNSAVAFFERKTPFRGEPNGPRPMLASRKRNQVVLRKGNGDIAFRYHSTDVVTYHPDQTITLHGWDSQSTDAFANGLLPDGICTAFNHPRGYLIYLNGGRWGQNGTAYLMRHSTITLAETDGKWAPAHDDETKPFRYPSVDRAKARAACQRYRIAEFAEFYAALKKFGGIGMSRFSNWDLSALEDEANWRDLASLTSPEKVRERIYKDEGCVKVELLDTLPSNQVSAWSAACKKWAGYY